MVTHGNAGSVSTLTPIFSFWLEAIRYFVTTNTVPKPDAPPRSVVP